MCFMSSTHEIAASVINTFSVEYIYRLQYTVNIVLKPSSNQAAPQLLQAKLNKDIANKNIMLS